jgi:hypothetical protein
MITGKMCSPTNASALNTFMHTKCILFVCRPSPPGKAVASAAKKRKALEQSTSAVAATTTSGDDDDGSAVVEHSKFQSLLDKTGLAWPGLLGTGLANLLSRRRTRAPPPSQTAETLMQADTDNASMGAHSYARTCTYYRFEIGSCGGRRCRVR